MIVTTCAYTPIFLAFPDMYTTDIMIFDDSLNILFLIDMALTFFVAFYDDEFSIIDDRKVSFLNVS